jgi:hypothetical protein
MDARNRGFGVTTRRFPATPRLKPGDLVIRRHRLLKTPGVVLRFDGADENGIARVWIRWRHSTTLPNPSLEPVSDLEILEPRGDATVP